ncbi:hypothetical protein [Ensifer adhaerens]
MATAATVFRDYETDGVPSSGAHKVKKSEARELFGGYEAIIGRIMSRQEATSTAISVGVKRVPIQFYAPNYAVPATLVGGASYRRISFASLTGFPAASYFRSLDRYMPDGTINSTNGGYWVIDEPEYQPEMFGAVQDFNGTTGTDAAAALSAMISTAKLLVVPMWLRSGKGYYCLSSLSATNMTLTLQGDNFGSSSIIFNNAGDGLVITQDDYKHATSLEAFSIFTMRQEPGVGLKITYSSGDSIGNRNVPRCKIIDVECRGYDIFSHGWSKGMLLTDVHRASVIRPMSTGRRNLPAGGVAQFLNMPSGIEVVGSYPPTFTAIPSEIIIESPRIDQCIAAIKSIGEVEGLEVNTPNFVAVDVGVFASYSTTRPYVKVAGGHINCFTHGVRLVNAPQSSVTDLLVYKYQDTVNDTVAVSVDGSDDTSVKNLTLVNQAANKNVNGEWNGVVVNNSARCTIDDIRHNAPSKTVILSGTTTLTRTSRLKPDGAYLNATVQTYDDSSSGTNEFSDSNKPIANVTNAALVNLADTTPAAVTQTVTLNVNKGERYLVTGNIEATKGGSAGQFLTQLSRVFGGGAAGFFGSNAGTVTARSDYVASANLGQSAAGIFTVTTSGTIVFQLVGTVTGSTATVAANKSQLSVVRL